MKQYVNDANAFVHYGLIPVNSKDAKQGDVIPHKQSVSRVAFQQRYHDQNTGELTIREMCLSRLEFNAILTHIQKIESEQAVDATYDTIPF